MEGKLERRLAAVLFADVAGYSRLIQLDEAATLSALRTRQADILEPLVSSHRGRIVKMMGDGAFVEFGSAVGAVQCAVAVQNAMASANGGTERDREIAYRIGISLGDVVVQGEDLFGEGINIAARLQQLADPGSIVVSETVAAQARGKGEFRFEDMGERFLKNMAEPVRVYRVEGAGPGQPVASIAASPRAGLPVAVLPFENISGDPEQDYFSDGITDDIITDLTKISALDVLSRSTAFAFKGKQVSIARLWREMRIAFVVEGNVRRSGGRVRISAQLIDAERDTQIWAERYDRDFSDVFALQDDLSQAIVRALKIQLLPEERRAIEARSTYDSEAYRLYLLGRRYFVLRGARNYEIALRSCRRALQADPAYARAWALSALCLSYLNLTGRSADSGYEEAKKALSFDPNLAEAHSAMGRILAEHGRFSEALELHRRSLALEPEVLRRAPQFRHHLSGDGTIRGHRRAFRARSQSAEQ